MIVALAALAALMTLGGAVALLNGWDVVLTERGWSQVIAGATGLTGGLVMAGVTCVVVELKRLRRDITAAVADAPDDDLPLAPPNPAAALAGAAGASAASSHIFDEASQSRPASAMDDAIAKRELEAGAADDGDETSRPDSAAYAPPTAPVEDDIGDPGEAGAEPPREPEVIGTYASAGVTYFMYSDNSIEAEMEQGRFRFETMDALRRFMETGEGGSLIAAADEDAPIAG